MLLQSYTFKGKYAQELYIFRNLIHMCAHKITRKNAQDCSLQIVYSISNLETGRMLSMGVWLRKSQSFCTMEYQ